MKKSAILAALLLLVASVAMATVHIGDTGAPSDRPDPIVKKAKAATAVAFAPADAESLTKIIMKDRSDTEIWLQTSPTSYLAAIARRDFAPRTSLTIGTDATSDLRLADDRVLPQHIRITIARDSFRIEPLEPAARFTVRGDSLSGGKFGPGNIGVGRFTMRLSHQHYPAIIVFDPQSPRFAEYKGLDWFPVDFKYRYELPLIANPDPDTVEIMSTHSQPRQAIRAGWFVFAVDGKRCLLEVNRLCEPGVGENDLSVFFRDETTGKESYDVGRYVEPVAVGHGNYVLDFNNAYNPACAFSPHYNCPIPPKINKLKVAIRAGEKNKHYMK